MCSSSAHQHHLEDLTKQTDRPRLLAACVLAAGVAGALLGALHASICSLPKVNDVALGIALMLFGTGLAFYLGKPLIEPTAPRLPAIDFGWWSDIPQVKAALQINVLFLIGVALAPLLVWAFRSTRWGLVLRTAGESADAALAMGYSVNMIRLRATMTGGGPVLLQMNMDAGHAGASGRFARLEETALVYAFALAVTGRDT